MLLYTESFVLLLYCNCITFGVVLLKALPSKGPDRSGKDLAAELGKDRTLSPIPNGKEKMATELKVNKCVRLRQPKLWERSLKGWQLYLPNVTQSHLSRDDRRIGGEECSAELAPNYNRTSRINLVTPTLSMVLLEWYRPPFGPIWKEPRTAEHSNSDWATVRHTSHVSNWIRLD